MWQGVIWQFNYFLTLHTDSAISGSGEMLLFVILVQFLLSFNKSTNKQRVPNEFLLVVALYAQVLKFIFQYHFGKYQ